MRTLTTRDAQLAVLACVSSAIARLLIRRKLAHRCLANRAVHNWRVVQLALLVLEVGVLSELRARTSRWLHTAQLRVIIADARSVLRHASYSKQELNIRNLLQDDNVGLTV